jgi:FtsP/CotA-like multicopper oxidase with cupredoxin domain
MRFTDFADAATPYMFHCHVLRHEDQGMMGQFVVVEPGGQPRLQAAHHHGG